MAHMGDREDCAHGACADISTAVTRTADEDENAGDEVDNECTKKEEPELEHPCDKWARCLGNFVRNRMKNQRKDCEP